MLWFKHLKDARNDPFVWDLRQRFGPSGYFVYFATLEIYADNFKPFAGWYLDISIEYLKHELGIYHLNKLKKIIDFIRSWPDVDGAEDRPLLADSSQSETAPKWIAQLTDKRIALLIPTFSRMMDNYTAQKLRESESTATDPAQATMGGVGFDILSAFRDIARHCEALADLPQINGRQFKAGDFVGWCVRGGYHPGAIRDGMAALVQQIKRWSDIGDPWAYGRGVVKTRLNHYSQSPVNTRAIKSIFGSFFGTSKTMGGYDGKSNGNPTTQTAPIGN